MTPPIHFEPPFPMQEILGIGVLLLLLAVVGYLFGGKDIRPGKKLFLVTLRTLALAGVVIVLCRPMAARPNPEPVEKPVFTVLVDTSASMNTKDEASTSRMQAAAAALQSARSAFLQDLGA